MLSVYFVNSGIRLILIQYKMLFIYFCDKYKNYITPFAARPVYIYMVSRKIWIEENVTKIDKIAFLNMLCSLNNFMKITILRHLKQEMCWQFQHVLLLPLRMA